MFMVSCHGSWEAVGTAHAALNSALETTGRKSDDFERLHVERLLWTCPALHAVQVNEIRAQNDAAAAAHAAIDREVDPEDWQAGCVSIEHVIDALSAAELLCTHKERLAAAARHNDLLFAERPCIITKRTEYAKMLTAHAKACDAGDKDKDKENVRPKKKDLSGKACFDFAKGKCTRPMCIFSHDPAVIKERLRGKDAVAAKQVAATNGDDSGRRHHQ